jgi:AraC-like DNA-binding protein
LFYTHVAQTYARSFHAASRPRGGLAPWQKTRVTDLFKERLDGPIRLGTLAEECGLSVSHFARAFRQSFGTPPHHYLVLQRIERARVLLSGSTGVLSEVAQQAGSPTSLRFAVPSRPSWEQGQASGGGRRRSAGE